MSKLIEIIHELRRAKGSKNKGTVLRNHGDNELWKKFLVATYDTRISYGVSAPSDNEFKEGVVDATFFESLNHLALRKVTGNKAKKLGMDMSQHYGEIARLVLGRSVKAGISVKSINNAYPGLVFEFMTMKGKDVPVEKYPVWASIKMDGCKIFVEVGPAGIIFRTSNGLEFKFTSLHETVSNYPYATYEGELIHGEGKQKDRPIITGKLNSLIAGTVDDIEDYKFMVYDRIPSQEWIFKKGGIPYDDRYNMLNEIYDKYPTNNVRIVKQFQVSDEETLIKYFNILIEREFEGLMCRYPEDPYMFTGDRRTDRLIKKKAIKQCVLTCVGTKPHTNEEIGGIGALICEGTIRDNKKGGIHIKVDVGGLSRYDMLSAEERFIGSDIEILYNVMTHTNRGSSLFLPRFKRVVGES